MFRRASANRGRRSRASAPAAGGGGAVVAAAAADALDSPCDCSSGAQSSESRALRAWTNKWQAIK